MIAFKAEISASASKAVPPHLDLFLNLIIAKNNIIIPFSSVCFYGLEINYDAIFISKKSS